MANRKVFILALMSIFFVIVWVFELLSIEGITLKALGSNLLLIKLPLNLALCCDSASQSPQENPKCHWLYDLVTNPTAALLVEATNQKETKKEKKTTH